MTERCGVCGGTHFTPRSVLWQGLIDEWQIAPDEVAYIDRQQGCCCDDCGANLRSIALANAIRSHLGIAGTLKSHVEAGGSQAAILEINEAGTLSPMLRRFPNYVFGAYPEVDMHALPYAAQSFDVVVHSDTLEHVPNPIHALGECLRVLKPGGALCFTVPMIVGRLSRNRDGLPKSWHGNPETSTDDFIVQTEFGADAWTYVMRAGFAELGLHAVDFPSAIAFRAVAPR